MQGLDLESKSYLQSGFRVDLGLGLTQNMKHYIYMQIYLCRPYHVDLDFLNQFYQFIRSRHKSSLSDVADKMEEVDLLSAKKLNPTQTKRKRVINHNISCESPQSRSRSLLDFQSMYMTYAIYGPQKICCQIWTKRLFFYQYMQM